MRSMFPRPISVENLAFFVDFDEILNFTLIYVVNFSLLRTEDTINR